MSVETLGWEVLVIGQPSGDELVCPSTELTCHNIECSTTYCKQGGHVRMIEATNFSQEGPQPFLCPADGRNCYAVDCMSQQECMVPAPETPEDFTLKNCPVHHNNCTSNFCEARGICLAEQVPPPTPRSETKEERKDRLLFPTQRPPVTCVVGNHPCTAPECTGPGVCTVERAIAAPTGSEQLLAAIENSVTLGRQALGQV